MTFPVKPPTTKDSKKRKRGDGKDGDGREEGDAVDGVGHPGMGTAPGTKSGGAGFGRRRTRIGDS